MSVLSAEQNLRSASLMNWKIAVTMWSALLPSLATNAESIFPCADTSIGMEKLRSCKMTSIFCLFCLLTNASTCGIIGVWFNGPWTDVRARISARLTPYGIFLLLLATLIWPSIFPKTSSRQGRSGIRICRIICLKLNFPIGKFCLPFYYNIFFYKNQTDNFI